MVFVERSNGKIIGEYGGFNPGVAEEELAEDHPEVVSFRNPNPSPDGVIAERERRLALGFNYDFGDARGVHHIGTTEQDMKGWKEVTDFASALVALGDATTLIAAVTATGPVQVTGLEWQQILVAAAQFRQPIWAASFALQAMTPIPADFADDAHWPGFRNT